MVALKKEYRDRPAPEGPGITITRSREGRSYEHLRRTPAPRGLDRRDLVPTTLGTPNAPRGAVIASRDVLSQVVIKETAGDAILGTVDWIAEILNKGRVSVVPRQVAMPPPVIRGPVTTVTGPQSKGAKVGLDLGNLLNTGLDLYAKYEGIKNPVARPIMAAPVAAAASRVTDPALYNWEQGMAGPQFISTPGGGLPGVDIIAEPPAEAISDGMKGWAYKKSCGEWKWVKTGRRRRRKLLTDSDYNGLLKLQTLKVNSNMNIAIAKSIGR